MEIPLTGAPAPGVPPERVSPERAPLHRALRVMLVAGEASADQYAARVASELRSLAPGCELFGIGGDHCAAAGAELLYHTRDTAVMGFLEVVTKYVFFRRMFARCTAELDRRRPDAVLLLDYPGFNLRFAAQARRRGIPVVYYISPQVWAWGKGRAKTIASLVDALAVVFPFEKDIYAPFGAPVTFVGHPLLEILPSIPRGEFLRGAGLPDAGLLALLPGSRRQEIDRVLPVLLETADALGQREGVVPVIGAAPLPDEVYAPHLARHPRARLLRGSTHHLMEHARCAVVTSGTATVETALYGTPMVIVYRTSAVTYHISRRIISVPFIGMPNLLAGRRIVRELIQDDLTIGALAAEVQRLLRDDAYREAMQRDLALVREQLGAPGASRRVAELLMTAIRK